LLAGDDFLGKLSNEWVSTVDQQQASHFDGTSVMRYHHREKITVRITGLRSSRHLLVHLLHCRRHQSSKLGTDLASMVIVGTVLAPGWSDQEPPQSDHGYK
jgi:hypothetical protein